MLKYKYGFYWHGKIWQIKQAIVTLISWCETDKITLGELAPKEEGK